MALSDLLQSQVLESGNSMMDIHDRCLMPLQIVDENISTTAVSRD